MKRRGFTLVEMLVAVAVVALLAAILLPVLVRARESGKQSRCSSNIRQIGMAITLYTGDYDDYYPRTDDCIQGGSLNPELNEPGAVTGNGCSGPFPYRVNMYKWQAWVMPYVNDIRVFMCGSRQRDRIQWETNGEIHNGYALNLSLTGYLNTWNRPPTANFRINDSFLGGQATRVPEPSSTMILMELSSTRINFVPALGVGPPRPVQTIFPAASRELWQRMFYRLTAPPTDCAPTDTIDQKLVPHNQGLVVGRVDGSAKHYSAKAFLAETPSQDDYVVTPPSLNVWPCGPTAVAHGITAQPAWARPWPLWGLD